MNPPSSSIGTDNASARRLAGSCLCGSVQYTVADAFAYAMNCHCSNCRRTTGDDLPQHHEHVVRER